MSRFLVPAEQGPRPDKRSAPEFSVVIPAFEAATTIADAVESALAQTYPAKEVIVCDDGSADDPGAALERFGEQVVVLRQENAGPSAARNAAIARASGDFVVGLDADDVLSPGNLAARAELIAQRPDLDIVCTNADVSLDGEVLRQMFGEEWRFEIEDQRSEILKRCFIAFWAVRRSRILAAGGFDEEIRAAEDWECWIRLILAGARAGLVDEPLAEYRLRQGSLSNQPVGLLEDRIATMRKTLASADLRDSERAALEAMIAGDALELRLAKVSEALIAGALSARRESGRLAIGAGVPFAARVRAALAWVSPRLARWMLTRRGRMTGAGIALPVE